MARGKKCDKKKVILYNGHESDKHEFGTGFYIGRHIMDNLFRGVSVY
jgi:hypothetical protein